MLKRKKLNNNHLSKIILLILVTFIVSGLIIVSNNTPQIKESFYLSTTKIPEKFTELYFENHLDLPTDIELGKEETIKFTIQNLENQTIEYKYEIKAIDDEGKIILALGSARVNHDEFITINENYTLNESIGKTKIQVTLVDQNQSIHYWMNQL